MTLLAFAAAEAESPTKAEVKRAAPKAIPIIQHSAKIWTERSGCYSCHHQGLSPIALSAADQNGLKIDREKLRKEIDEYEDRPTTQLKQYEGTGAINGTAGFGFWLWGRSADGRPQTNLTESSIHYLLAKQAADGRWPSLSHRPPLEDSPVTLTAVAIRALRTYAPDYLSDSAKKSIRDGRAWLRSRQPRNNEEAVFKLFGLVWAEAPRADIQDAASDLAKRQRVDGGWAQLPTRQSDAYATGQALSALALAKASTKGQVYSRGVSFLVRTQMPDGTWLVTTRRKFPGLPYFESGFPYREHQFISYSGSAWALSALALYGGKGSMPGLKITPAPSLRSSKNLLSESPKDDRLLRAVLKGTLSELIAAAEAGGKINARSIGGATPLMYAVRDLSKVKWLLKKGADPNAVSDSRSTALMIAADTRGALESVRALLAAGADPNVFRTDTESPLAFAAMKGESRMVDVLLKSGAKLTGRGNSALLMAIRTEHYAIARKLARAGADINAPTGDDGTTILDWAVMDGDEGSVAVALELGANPNTSTIDGITPLHAAAMIDPGSTRIVQRLLEAGADPTWVAVPSRTPLDLARKHQNFHLAKLFETFNRNSLKSCPNE
jgi:ankyrin repeat protein